MKWYRDKILKIHGQIEYKEVQSCKQSQMYSYIYEKIGNYIQHSSTSPIMNSIRKRTTKYKEKLSIKKYIEEFIVEGANF